MPEPGAHALFPYRGHRNLDGRKHIVDTFLRLQGLTTEF